MASPKKAAPVAPGPSTAATATSPAPEKQQLTDYRKYFQPFFIKPNVKMATAPFPRDGEYRRTISEAIDAALAKPLPPSDPAIVAPLKGTNAAEIAALLHIAPHKRNRAPQFLAYSTKDIVARINAPDDPGLPPIGPASKSALNKSKLTPEYYLKLLNSLPNKYLRFAEDVRPPYCGTFTRKPTTRGLQRGAKPFDRSLPGVNYDYDSEAEWVADDDGEDLMTDDEDDKDSIAGSDDLDGFLDDEDDVMMKRGALGALVATNSGLCWEDEKGKNPRPDLDEMRIEVLMGMHMSFSLRFTMTLIYAQKEYVVQSIHFRRHTGVPRHPKSPQ